MKKLLAVLLAMTMLFALCACDGKDSGDKADGDSKTTPAEKKASVDSVATDYVEAMIEGDMKAQMTVMAGKAQKYFEEVTYGDDDERDEEFEWMEDACDEEKVDVSISSFSEYYVAYKKLTEVQMEDCYGDRYTTKVEVRETADMKDKVIEAYRVIVDDATCADYIDPDKIAEGKFVTVKVYIDGKEESGSYDVVVPVVKYDGAWKVLEYDVYTEADDYDWDEDKEEARTILYAAESGYDEDDYDDEGYYYDEEEGYYEEYNDGEFSEW